MFNKEVVHDSEGLDKRQFSSKIIEAKPFREARVKQGGYGLLEDDFWLWRIPKRGFHVFTMTISGSGYLVMEDGTRISLKENQAFLSNSNGQGHYEATENHAMWEMVWMTFWDDSPIFQPSTTDYEIRTFLATKQLKETALNILNEEIYQDKFSDEAVELYERLFLMNLLRGLSMSEDNNIHGHRIEFLALWEKVSKNIRENWTVNDLCRESGYSKAHLSRLCHELYGKAPGEMVKDMKMREAKVRLLNSDQSIEEVAQSVGFNCLSTFSSAFSDYFGLSPRSFRKNHKGTSIIQ